jgi:hypothetical protein
MPVTPPANLTYGTITGKFFLTQLDSADTGREPDYIPASGNVTFTPAVSSYKNLSLPAFFATIPVVATIDASGDLRDSQGGLGVYLVATNNPEMVPRDWTYTVTITLTGQSPISFPILVTGGSTTDLTIAAPVATSAGTAIVVSSSDRIAAQAAATAAQASADAAAASAAAAAGGGGGGLDTEAVQDAVGAMTSGSGYVSVTYNDAAGTLVVAGSAALTTALGLLAPKANPTFTGTVTMPNGALTIANTSGLQGALDARRLTATAGIFPIFWTGSAWQYTTLAAAQAAGMQASDSAWFIGNPGGSPASWMRDNDVWTQG